MIKQSLFKGIQQKDISFDGIQGKSPMFFKNMCFFGSTFLADYETCRSLLPLSLYPLRVSGRKSLASLFCMEYKETDIGPYNEVSLAIPCLPRDVLWRSLSTALIEFSKRRFSFYVVRLPVSTQASYLGGMAFFNFPKFLADITFRETQSHRICTVRHFKSLELIIEFQLRKMPLKKKKDCFYSFYTFPAFKDETDGGEFKVLVHQKGETFFRPQSMVRFGKNEEAQKWKDLQLGFEVQSFYSPRSEALLYPPGRIPLVRRENLRGDNYGA